MKKSILSVMFLAGAMSLMAQTTALVPYTGGYFVKNGDAWEEYRPGDEPGMWTDYKQYREDDTFFFVKNKKCCLAIPKIARDKIFIDREKNGKWEIVYNTIDVYNICPEKDGLFYCYKDGGGDWYNGYFVRDNNVWREYRHGMKRGVWAEFKQTGEDRDYFYLESSENKVSIPKNTSRNIVITKPGSSWRGGYSIKAIYDRSAEYDYNFYFNNTVSNKGKEFGKSARVSFNRNNRIQIACNGKHYDLEYKNIELVEEEGRRAIRITIDNKNSLLLLPQGKCVVQCKAVGAGAQFLNGSNDKVFKEVTTLLYTNSFYPL